MKTTVYAAALFAGLSFVGWGGVGHAQMEAPMGQPVEETPGPVAKPGDIPYSLQRMGAFFTPGGDLMPRPDVQAVGGALHDAIVAVQPQAKFEYTANSLLVTYQPGKYQTHLRDANGRISKEAADKFPAGFDELWLRVSLEHDSHFYRGPFGSQSQTDTFGTTFKYRYDLRPSQSRPTAKVEDTRDWIYGAYDALAKAKLVASRGDAGAARELTRGEVAQAIAPLLQDDGETLKPDLHLQDNAAPLSDLQREFAPELFDLESKAKPNQAAINGQTWQAPQDYLAVDFSYGKGVSPALVTKIKQILDDYSAEQLAAQETEPTQATR